MNILPYVMVGGAGVAIYVIYKRSAYIRWAQSEEGRQEILAGQLEECGTERQCRMRAIYASQGRDWDAERSTAGARAIQRQDEQMAEWQANFGYLWETGK